MHLNALYRTAEAGRRALKECADALTEAAKWNGYAPRALAGKPLKYWHLRHARQFLDDAKRHLRVVRDNISIAELGKPVQIDSSGGYAIADLLQGGLLDVLIEIDIDRKTARALPAVKGLLAQVGELMLRMRKAGAVD